MARVTKAEVTALIAETAEIPTSRARAVTNTLFEHYELTEIQPGTVPALETELSIGSRWIFRRSKEPVTVTEVIRGPGTDVGQSVVYHRPERVVLTEARPPHRQVTVSTVNWYQHFVQDEAPEQAPPEQKETP